MITILVFFLLFLVPFINIPTAGIEVEATKVLVSEAGILILFLVTFFTNKLQIQWKSLQSICLLIIFAITLIDTLFFKSTISLAGNIFRLQGIFLLWFLLLLSFISKNSDVKRIPYWVYTIILTLQTLLLFVFPINESNRYTGTFGEPNALAAFAIFVWPFSFFAMKKFGRKEIFTLLLNAIFVGCILFLSGSRSALIGLGIQLIFILFQKLHISLKKAIIISLLVYVLSYALPFSQHNFYENRTEIWESAVIAGWDKPFLGWGIGNVEKALFATSHALHLTVKDSYVDSSHNIFLDWWVMGGIIGVGTCILLVVTACISFVKQKKYRELTLLLGLLTALSFNPASVSELVAFWWLIGQAET